MRRSVSSLVVLLIAAGLATVTARATAAPPDPSLVATPQPAVHCYTITDNTGAPYDFCDHGADIPMDPPRATTAEPLVPQATTGIKCYGNGQDGMRVQAVYAVSATGLPPDPNRLAAIKTYAAQVESEVSMSAAETGGERHVRWVTNSSCDLDIVQVTLPSPAVDVVDLANPTFFSATITDMLNLGFNRPDRVYMIWYETENTTDGCGIANLGSDDRASSLNVNWYGPRFARIDKRCYASAETHELGHTMGAVQRSAPHSTPAGHCTDEWDIMCYDDDGAGPVTMDYTNATGNCPPAHDRLYDCNHDDYFNTNPAPDNYLATHWNVANSPVLAQTDSRDASGAGAYHSLTKPVRLVDTRLASPGSLWAPAGLSRQYPTHPSLVDPVKPARLISGRHYLSKVTGFDAANGTPSFNQQPFVTAAGVPNVGVAAVVLNVTVIDPSSGGFLSLRPYNYDTFLTTPLVSNINYSPGQVIPNEVTITVPVNGLIDVYASAGSPFVIFDVAGWFADASGSSTAKGSYHPLSPTRIMNTRTGLRVAAITPNAKLDLKVTGGSIDAAFAGAVVLNVTAAETTDAGYFTVWPAGQIRPTASNVNFPAGGAASNLVIVGVGVDGKISIYNETGSANVIVDLLGWFDNGGTGAPAGATYVPITPARLVDTRSMTPPRLAAGSVGTYALRGGGSIPNTANVTAVIANVAAVQPTGGGYFTVYPSGNTVPETSTVNFVPNEARANLAFITLSATGQASVLDVGGDSHALIDVSGYFTT